MPNNAKVQLLGNLVRDPEMKTVGSSTVCSFTVAVNTTTKGADGNFISNFYDCSYWGKPGEFLMERAQKGTQVIVWGDLAIVEYTSDDGVARHRYRVNCTDVRAVSRLKEQPGNGGGGGHPAPAPAPAAPDNDMPF